MIEHAQKELQKLRKHIQDLNWQRKNMQLTAGSKWTEMESTWVSLVSKNYEIERTIVQLENELFQMKQQHGQANKENIGQDFWNRLARWVERKVHWAFTEDQAS